MDIRFHNTLTHRTESFAPLNPPDVFMYNCGPTVYDFAHIGNFRAFVFADVLRRFLELTGHNVHQVMNITDVGHMTEDDVADGGGVDKMEAAAARIKEAKKQGAAHVAQIENPEDPYQIARFYTDAFIADAKLLNVKIAFEHDRDPARTHMPHATDHVTTGMIPLIQKLIEKGHAYVGGDGAVYYDVESFPDYGKLSGNTLVQLKTGESGRVTVQTFAAKRHPADFLLWKPDSKHIMKWPSPWGEGYPGWHIECSAMARAKLGRDVIDIHTGGEDNIFPHHECEIAQTRGASGQPQFARFWMHTRFLLVEGEKMSKRTGNFFTVRDVLEGKVTGRAVDPSVLRYELLKGHYRGNANFTKKGLEDSASAVRRIREKARELFDAANFDEVEDGINVATPVLEAFASALADDLNVGGALGALFSWLGEPHGNPLESLIALVTMDRVLGVLPRGKEDENFGIDFAALGAGSGGVYDDNAAAICKAIDEARAKKDFKVADALRKSLVEAGYDVLTTKDGTVAKKKLA
jgi:cysteinyl-tRNA synthetase